MESQHFKSELCHIAEYGGNDEKKSGASENDNRRPNR
jgi:hypothetical protein